MCEVFTPRTKRFGPIYTVCGLEFGNYRVGTMAIVVYVHGLESSGARRREQLTNTLYEFGFTSYKPTRMSGCDPKQANGDA
jgi:hypothetical protein